VVARRIGTLPLSLATAMDIDDTNGDVWVTNYFQAFCFRCTDRTLPIQQQLQQLPKPQELPRWRQIEAIAVDSGLQLWVTSEGSPAPLGRIPIK